VEIKDDEIDHPLHGASGERGGELIRGEVEVLKTGELVGEGGERGGEIVIRETEAE
jgi:hypothetical protein